jgi:parvulin-like peptidyl-prolyl isomerase
VHFLLFAVLLLAFHHLITGSQQKTTDAIGVTAAKILQILLLLARTLQRAPTPDETKFAIDDYVKEEIYNREAIKLGLDRDYTVIRRRLRQKMEFLGDAAAEQIEPTEAELQRWFDAHKNRFAEEPSLAFQQVFVSTAQRGDAAAAEARALLERLRSEPELDFRQLGDPTTLPSEVPLAPASAISLQFGPDFSATLEQLETGAWAGPIATSFGLHLVRVEQRKGGAVPNFAAVRTDVAREWAYAKRQELEEARFAEYLKKYQVKILAGALGDAP